MMTTQRTKYDKEFKQKLVELARARGNAKQIAGIMRLPRASLNPSKWNGSIQIAMKTRIRLRFQSLNGLKAGTTGAAGTLPWGIKRLKSLRK
jgi:hypothetical protein